MGNKISTKDQLTLKLLDYTDTERLERHVDVEIALAGKHKEVEMLREALKRKEQVIAGLRYDLKKIVEEHA